MRFVLVHGGFHGAWCWDRLIPELTARGHEAVAIDLPGAGARVDEDVEDLRMRAAAIVEVMQPGDVLVGHSGGGYDISVAADLAPERVGHLVYLAAGLPLEGETIMAATGGAASNDPASGRPTAVRLMDDDTGMLRYIRAEVDGRLHWFDRNGALDFFYHDCDEALVDWAYAQLTPASAHFSLQVTRLPAFWAAQLPRSYIRCTQDRAKPRWMSEQVIDRLGVRPLEIEASHSPFLSCPALLAERLMEATRTRPLRPMRPGP